MYDIFARGLATMREQRWVESLQYHGEKVDLIFTPGMTGINKVVQGRTNPSSVCISEGWGGRTEPKRRSLRGSRGARGARGPLQTDVN